MGDEAMCLFGKRRNYKPLVDRTEITDFIIPGNYTEQSYFFLNLKMPLRTRAVADYDVSFVTSD